METKGIVYVADHSLPADISEVRQQQLLHSGLYIVSVSLRPLDFGDNLVLGLERSALTMFKQILMGVSNLQEDIAFICGPNVLYSRSHFQFVPLRNDIAYFNGSVQPPGGSPLWQICAHTRFLIDYYGTRMKRIEREIGRGRQGCGIPRCEEWSSEGPNIVESMVTEGIGV